VCDLFLKSAFSKRSHKKWAADYESIIVSAGPWYSKSHFNQYKVTTKPFPRDRKPDQEEDISFISTVREMERVNSLV
jgi:hypothetical protein